MEYLDQFGVCNLFPRDRGRSHLPHSLPKPQPSRREYRYRLGDHINLQMLAYAEKSWQIGRAARDLQSRVSSRTPCETFSSGPLFHPMVLTLDLQPEVTSSPHAHSLLFIGLLRGSPHLPTRMMFFINPSWSKWKACYRN
jgi:hypothetical protein